MGLLILPKQTFHPSFLTPKKPNEDLNRPRLQFRLRTNDTHHLLCPIRPTTMSHSHNSLNSPLKMPKLRTSKGPPKAGVDDGAFFKAARRTGLKARSAFSRERESWKPEQPSSKC